MIVERNTDEHPALLADQAVARGALQKPGELADLLRLLHRERPQVIIEIGTCGGQTLAAFSHVAAPGPLLVSVDLPGGEYGGGIPLDGEGRIREWCRPDARVVFVQGDSHQDRTREQVAQALDGTRADLLFIDGDHTYQGVLRDYRDYRGFVRAGGLIAFHDIITHSPHMRCHVDKAWREIKRDGVTQEFTQPHLHAPWGPWGGIGVIRV